MAGSPAPSDPIDADIRSRYAARYAGQGGRHLYPVEFVVRALLGTYPGLDLREERPRFAGADALDLGCGDGRNAPLLHNLGFRVHGVEIHQDIVASTAETLRAAGIRADLRVGTNRRIPFDAGRFHLVLACHSCYYVEEGTTFDMNLAEIHRVSRSGGLFVASLPMTDTYILDGAEVLPDGHFRIRHDPYGLREGTVFRAFRDAGEIGVALGPWFSDLRIGFCDDEFWGIRQKVWTVVGRARSTRGE